jgi:hypothetical protein
LRLLAKTPLGVSTVRRSRANREDDEGNSKRAAQAIIQAVNQTFRHTEAEALERFEAPLIAADALRLLLEETGQTARAANLGTIGGLAQLLSSLAPSPAS